ncbi:L,D-transpeptidase family protein [Corynebacterium poyangense]|uniref:L,D-transpeptidase family protein n=1 Tax=Corynebacterium poyangense TaxID=2684405 RepID=A0A7H0SM54_9CORY|nr:L,D-transpeptidase [Corynebacterium poyangense]MBZ8176725.1 L,D-transpeptidase family protein [Corynebacterium poyangense]QNQ89629.1 L,D-transpeptidase family protein [Corynebacterium poyangense]
MSYKPRHAKPSKTKQRVTIVASSGAVAAGIALNPANAAAVEVPQLPQLNVPQLPTPDQAAAQLDHQARDWVWNNRNYWQSQAQQLPEGSSQQASQAIDGVVEAIYPGMIAELTPAPVQLEPAAPVTNAPGDHSVCPAAAKACIDLEGHRSWLQENGQVTYGDVPISSGAAGTPTPKGTYTVTRKVKDEISHEFNNAPMPYSVYFTNTGIAFHEGDVNVPSAGCIHLSQQDAIHYFNNLEVGDTVYVY